MPIFYKYICWQLKMEKAAVTCFVPRKDFLRLVIFALMESYIYITGGNEIYVVGEN